VIDHLVYAAPDLAEAIADLEQRLGIRAEPGGRHPGLGTQNALLSLGSNSYLEILAPDPGQPAPPMPRAFGLDDYSEGGLAAWALACSDIDRAVARARERGYDPGDALEFQRDSPTGAVLRWQLTVNAYGGGSVPFLISWGSTQHPSLSAPQGLTLESFRLEDPHPSETAKVLTALGVNVEVTPAATTRLVAVVTGPTGTHELC
jgi:hypothetical protein